MISSNSWILLLVGLVLMFGGNKAAPPPKWQPSDHYGRSYGEYKPKTYNTEEQPGAQYNPNLPEDLRVRYKGQKWSEEVKAHVCMLAPDSGYYCNGAVGDLPPLHQRFYFDVQSMSCRCFLYSGCDGNQNNFRSHEHCLEWCSPNMTLFDWRTTGKTIYSFAKNSADCFYIY